MYELAIFGFMSNALTIWAIKTGNFLSYVLEHRLWRYRYIRYIFVHINTYTTHIYTIHPFHPYSFIDWCAARLPLYGVDSISLCWAPALHASLSCGQRQPGYNYLRKFSHIQTMSSQAVLAFQWRESESSWEICYRTWSAVYGHNSWVADVKSSMSSFCSSKADGVSSLSLKQIQTGVTDPADYGAVITIELLQFRIVWSPRVATVEHSRANGGFADLSAYPRSVCGRCLGPVSI